jgi:prepilin-type processing-associated H-X9-DG protein
MEQSQIFDKLDLSQNMLGGSAMSGGMYFMPHVVEAAEATLPVLHCPSDPAPKKRQTTYASGSAGSAPVIAGTCNYMVCTGSDYMRVSAPGAAVMGGAPATKPNGLFYHTSSYNFESIQDGTSNTMAIAEACVGIERDTTGLTVNDCISSKLYRTLMYGESPAGMGGPAPLDFQNASDSGLANGDLGGLDTYLDTHQTPSAEWQNNRGLSWVLIQPAYTTFGAFLPPNAKLPSYWNMNQGFFMANSYHTNGVSAAFADGSVRWVSNSVDLRMWRLAASISDGEVFSGF